MLQKYYLANLYTAENNERLAQLQDALVPAYPSIVENFYSELLVDDNAHQFLDNEVVETRLTHELERWMTFTLSPKTEQEAQTAVEIQRHVGEVHARINVPMMIVDGAMMMVKNGCFRALLAGLQQREDIYEAVLLVNAILESSLSLINEAFMQGLVENERNAQSFRTNISSHELVLEVERVRTDLFNWLSETTLDLMSGNRVRPGTLTHADFALWITHKLDLVCDQLDTCEKVKLLLKDAEQALAEEQDKDPRALCITLNKLVNDIAWQLSEIARTVSQMTERVDPLTQVIDRKYLSPVIQKETRLVLMGQEPYAVIMMDIDHFKAINDQHGHHAGDTVLAQVGGLLRKTSRISDYCFRYGGEEFMILLPECDVQQAWKIAEDTRHTINNTIISLEDHQTLRLTASFGIAQFTGHPDYMQTIKAADQALYQAKRQGRNQSIINPGTTLATDAAAS